MAESFYFDSNGYVLRNTTTPDGYQVNRIGAWVVGGEVKQKAGGETKNGGSGNNSSSNSSNSNSSYSYDTDWYFKVDGISELDIAYYHYYAKYYSWDGRSAERDAKVNEQVDRKRFLQKSIMDRNSSRSKVLADITGEATEWEAITAWVWPLILTRTQTHR